MLRSISLIFLLFVSLSGFGQTVNPKAPKVFINSGSPKFPFPQFTEYKQGKTIAKYNPEGVTHADMEKAIRQAYQVMANRFRYTDVVVGGVKYIRSNLGCPYDCAEGEGYGLLAAAYMADKITFDGIWMRVHDDMVVRTPSYKDGTVKFPTYRYGRHTIKEESGDAAADGDYDIGLALLMATKQWGPTSGVMVADGKGGKKNMSYLEEAINIISDFTDTVGIVPLTTSNIEGYLSGHIGIDGYPKGGNTFGENTAWGFTNSPIKPSKEVPENDDNQDGFASYLAPAYYRSFAKFLEENGGSAWCIDQYKKAEAASEWILQKSYDQNRLPIAGGFDVNGTNVIFKNGDPKQGKSDGEAFRMPWRTILNYLWRGDGIYTWNPTTHTYTLAPNSSMRLNAERLSEFIANPGICTSQGAPPPNISSKVHHSGISQVRQDHLGDGTANSENRTNYLLGTASPSVAASGNDTLMATLYRQLELKWDDENTALGVNDTVIENSTPKYFHGWFRLLGMLTLTGNLHAPEDMVATANMKVYMAVNKTFAYVDDEITYTVDYRNYGSLLANDVQITVPVSSQYEIIDNGGGTVSGNTITYTIGTVLGAGNVVNAGQKSFKVKVKNPKTIDRVCQTATIVCSNGSGWTSNEYPNNQSYTMERNCVDILGKRSLKIEKTANRTEVNPTKEVEFTLKFENSSEGGWLNGGRKNVNFSYAFTNSGPNAYFHLFRQWNNAEEAYIRLSNYRVSYFMFDNVNKGIYNASTNSTGWTLTGKNLHTGKFADFTYTGEKIPVGSDTSGKWDQRIIIRFPDILTAPTHTIFNHLNNRFQLHKGTVDPVWYSIQMESNPPNDLFTKRILDDWSFVSDRYRATSPGENDNPYSLIGPNYADLQKQGLVMDRYDKDVCNEFFTPNKLFRNVLVEEFDGYTWRRIGGNGPMPGREMYNVTVVDTIPADFEFVKFTDNEADSVLAKKVVVNGREVIVWTVPRVLVGMKGDIKYVVKAKGTCPATPDKLVTNKAWIFSDTDSPLGSSADVKVTCGFVTPPFVGTTMSKKADKASYAENENVEYTIGFKQTLGTASIPPTTDASRWLAIDGAATDLPSFTATGISFDNNKPGLFIKEKYSHGKNGTLVVDVDHDGQELFGLVFRHTSGTRTAGPLKGLYLEIQLAYFGNQANIKLYEDGQVIGSIAQEGYAAPFDKAKIKVELKDGVMNLWLNEINGLPFQTFTGIKNRDAGYAGFAVGDVARSSGTSSKPKILKWDAHFDSAFDVEISDPLPSGLTYVSSTPAGTNTTNTVTWPKIAGPMLYNDSVTYKVTAKIGTTCPANGKIVNLSYVNLFGMKKDSIGAQSVTSCGAPSTCVPPTSLKGAPDSIALCFGADTSLKATYTLGTPSKGYQYVWYNAAGAKPSATDYKTAYTDLKLAKLQQSGNYILRIEDGTTGDAKCYLETTVKVNVLPKKPAPTFDTAFYCLNAPAATFQTLSKLKDTLRIENSTRTHQYKGSNVPQTSFSDPLAPTDLYYVTVIDANKCASEEGKMLVKVFPLPTKPNIQTSDICGVGTVPAKVTSPVQGYTYTWSFTGAGASLSSITGDAIQVTTGKENVVLTVKAKDARCENTSNPVTITVSLPDTAVAGINGNPILELCASDAVKNLVANAPKNGGKGLWVLLATDSSSNATPADVQNPNSAIQNMNTPGDIMVVAWTITSKGCPESADTLVVKATGTGKPKINIVPSKTELCAGDSLTLTVNGSNAGNDPRYSLLDEGGATLVGPQASNVFKIGNVQAAQLKYRIRLTSNSTCVAQADRNRDTTLPTNIQLYQASGAATIVPDQATLEVCGATTTLSAQPNQPGLPTWSVRKGDVGKIDPLSGAVSELVANGSAARFYLQVQNGVCPASKDSIDITVSGLISTANVKDQSTAACKGAPLLTFLGSAVKQGETATWKAKTSSSNISPSGQVTQVAVGVNVFYYEVTSTICPAISRDSVLYTVKGKPKAEVDTANLAFCTGQPAPSLIAKDAGAGATYEWSNATGRIGTGNPFPAPGEGSYSVKVTLEGCDSTSRFVKLTTKTPPVAHIDTANTSYCVGTAGAILTATPVPGATFKWFKDLAEQTAVTGNEMPLALAGAYFVSVTLNGCTSTSNTVEVKEVTSLIPSIQIETPSNEVCANLPVTVSITSRSNGTIQWLVDKLPQGDSLSYTFVPTKATQVIAQLTTTESCANPKEASDTLEITPLETVTPTFTPRLDKIGGLKCEGDTAYFSATQSPGTISWDYNSMVKEGATFQLTDWTNAVGTVKATFTSSQACATPKEISIDLPLQGNVRQTITPQISPSANGTICVNDTLKLQVITGVKGLDYEWSYNRQFDNDSLLGIPLTATTSGTVLVKGCFPNGTNNQLLTFSYAVAQPVQIAIAGQQADTLLQHLCEDDVATLSTDIIGNVDSLRWYVGNQKISEKAFTASIANLKNNDWIKVEALTQLACGGNLVDSVQIKVDRRPSKGINTLSDTVYHCAGKDTLVTARETASNYRYVWRLNGDSIGNTRTQLLSGTALYQLVVINKACTTLTSISAKDVSVSVTISTDHKEFFPGELLTLQANVQNNPYSRPITYQWWPAALMSTPTEQNTTVSPVENGFVGVRIRTEPEGCTATDSIELKKRDKLFIPNALTPGSNDLNAFWGIKGAENYPDMEIKVFNRWGSIVHEQKGYSQPWDGTLNGKDLPTGTYYYVLKHRDLDKPLVGDLTIVR